MLNKQRPNLNLLKLHISFAEAEFVEQLAKATCYEAQLARTKYDKAKYATTKYSKAKYAATNFNP